MKTRETKGDRFINSSHIDWNVVFVKHFCSQEHITYNAQMRKEKYTNEKFSSHCRVGL